MVFNGGSLLRSENIDVLVGELLELVSLLRDSLTESFDLLLNAFVLALHLCDLGSVFASQAWGVNDFLLESSDGVSNNHSLGVKLDNVVSGRTDVLSESGNALSVSFGVEAHLAWLSEIMASLSSG